jgi:hypothetical protein
VTELTAWNNKSASRSWSNKPVHIDRAHFGGGVQATARMAWMDRHVGPQNLEVAAKWQAK